MGDTAEKPRPRHKHTIQSVVRALTVYDLIRANPGKTVKQLSRLLGTLPEKTLRDYLNNLLDTGWIVIGDEGRHYANPERQLTEVDLQNLVKLTTVLSAAPAALSKVELAHHAGLTGVRLDGAIIAGIQAGMIERSDTGGYRLTALPRRKADERIDTVLEGYAKTTGHDAALATLYDGRLVLTHLHTVPGHPSLLAPVGTDAAHATSAGHALLDGLAPDQFRDFLEKAGMPRFTARTPTTPTQLELLLNRDSAGIYTAEGQYCPDGACLAVGLRRGAPDGRCVAFTTSVYLPELQQKREQLKADLFRVAAQLAPIVGPLPLEVIAAGIRRMEAAAGR